MIVALGCAAPPPKPDGFYIAPKRKKSASSEERESVRRRKPGDLIRSESIASPLPGSAAWKILYVSTGLDGETIDVSGVVIAPARPAGTWANRIVVRGGSRVHIIPAEKLDRAQAQDDYVALKSDGKT